MNNNLSDDGFGRVDDRNNWSKKSVWSDDEENNSDASHNTPPPSTPPSTQHEDNKTAKAPPLLPTRARRSKSSTANTSHTAAHKQMYAVGTTVSKVFFDEEMGEERPFSGSVIGYDTEEKLYSVKYEDGDEEELNEQELSKIIDEGGSGKIQAKAATSNKQQGKLKGKSSSTNNDAYSYSSYDDMVAAKKKPRTKKKFTMKDDDNMDEDSDSGAGGKKNAMEMLMKSKSGRKTKKVTYTDNNDTEDDDTEDDEGLDDSDDEEMLSKKKKAKKINAKAGGKKKGGGKGGGNKHKTFAQHIADLKAYKEKHGHVNVKKSEDKSLNTFLQNIRQARKHPGKSSTLINEERIASLDALGFEWTTSKYVPTAKSFEQRIEDLRAYKEKHGHTNVKEKEDKSLYGYCKNMRLARNNPEKSGLMIINEERIASLDALGFEWRANIANRGEAHAQMQRLVGNMNQYYSRADIQQTESGKRIASLELDQSNLSTNNPIEMGMEESANEDADTEARGENVSGGATAVSHVPV